MDDLHRPRSESDGYGGVYASGPFKSRPVAHPYKTVLRRLSAMGINPPERNFDESDRQYIVRVNHTYSGIYDDIIASGILGT